ncbi:MAG: sigma-54-dependent Fis family transcriptional regulator [Candidatus Delongbacteria bacterium]|nr:sigma-54-dependent Fis family transcriptional regulator [Candidatus Delongbacteria bacterium]
MRVEELHHKELLELDPEGGLIRFAGQRAVLLDATAMGLLRKYLVENFGETAARTVLTQFGFAQGWRMADAMRREFTWTSSLDWRRAGPRLCMLEGLFQVEHGSEDPRSRDGAMLLSSYEAEQHLLHFGRAESPVCWTISGLMSGYASHIEGEEIFVLEDRCLGRGQAGCHLQGRTRAEWGDERRDELTFFEAGRLQDCLDVSLHRVTETLKAVELKLKARHRALRGVTRHVVEPSGTVAKSKRMLELVDLARRVAKVDASLLITGESGSGKERIARLVHEESTRAAGPFVAVNCGAITETLLESELFGHARGAFTGASSDRPGLFEAANRGTLLLDEIGDVSPGMQVKLLRVLQEREIRRVGENRNRPIDVRIVAATNRDLSLSVADGAFRQDLYYRLRVVELRVPALRDRREDILPLARILLTGAATRLGRKISGLSPEAADLLLSYDWPGNVRELENTIERAVALTRGTRIGEEDLPEEIHQRDSLIHASLDSVRPLADLERDYILAALKHNEGNQTRTAAQLQIGSATLYRKLKSYGVGPGAQDSTTSDAPLG